MVFGRKNKVEKFERWLEDIEDFEKEGIGDKNRLNEIKEIIKEEEVPSSSVVLV